ncbi:MAG: flagellar protein FlbB [Spirochaetaceae bacterium]|jgi:flagellar protein FlbB|nr:flagellar protein FlbB [Spirochaetaceae bacterium]
MLGRIVVLLILILVLIGGGIVWFDYLNVIDAKTALAPLYRLIGREGRTQEDLGPDEYLNLDAERLAVRLEAEALRELDMDKRETDIQSRLGEIEQMAQELEQRKQALDDEQNSINAAAADAENMERNIEGIAQQLTNMQPERAVAIIAAMNDQTAVNVLRKTEEIAQRDGTNSIVPYWLSQMDPQRAAELQRKMVAGAP